MAKSKKAGPAPLEDGHPFQLAFYSPRVRDIGTPNTAPGALDVCRCGRFRRAHIDYEAMRLVDTLGNPVRIGDTVDVNGVGARGEVTAIHGSAQDAAMGAAVAWYEDGDEGASVGQDADHTVEELRQRVAEARDAGRESDYWAVELAAKQYAAGHRDTIELYRGAWTIQRTAAARKFLVMLRAAAKAEAAAVASKPLPEWAQTALAHGWKAPKGWKP